MRSNDVAAEALQELADVVVISGGDPYRVRAYEKAARSVAGYPLDLDTLDRKGLMAIPAVGAHTADKLLELRQTGRIAALEQLHAQLSAGLRALLGIPGLGPKRAAALRASPKRLLDNTFAATRLSRCRCYEGGRSSVLNTWTTCPAWVSRPKDLWP
jgi:DNA polymerase/3'-5' exonuclease PolX